MSDSATITYPAKSQGTENVPMDKTDAAPANPSWSNTRTAALTADTMTTVPSTCDTQAAAVEHQDAYYHPHHHHHHDTIDRYGASTSQLIDSQVHTPQSKAASPALVTPEAIAHSHLAHTPTVCRSPAMPSSPEACTHHASRSHWPTRDTPNQTAGDWGASSSLTDALSAWHAQSTYPSALDTHSNLVSPCAVYSSPALTCASSANAAAAAAVDVLLTTSHGQTETSPTGVPRSEAALSRSTHAATDTPRYRTASTTPVHTPGELSQLRRAVRQLRAQLLTAQETNSELRRRVDGLCSERLTTQAEMRELRERLSRSEERAAAQQRSAQESWLELCALRSQRAELERRLTEAWAAIAATSPSMHTKKCPSESVSAAIRSVLPTKKDAASKSPQVETLTKQVDESVSSSSSSAVFAHARRPAHDVGHEEHAHTALRNALASLLHCKRNDWTSILARVSRLRDGATSEETDYVRACVHHDDNRVGDTDISQRLGRRGRAMNVPGAPNGAAAQTSMPPEEDGPRRGGSVEHNTVHLFTSEVLGLIAALDHRVSGALRQRSPL